MIRAAATLLMLAVAAPLSASDAPYVPTPMSVVDAMLEIAKVGPQDYLIDLGSGDGRIPLRAATRFGARGFGVEIESHLVRDANAAARRQGVADRVRFETRDLFDTDVSGATVLTTYLFQSLNLRLRPYLLAKLKPGTRVVTHEFHFGNWQPDRRITVHVPDKPYGDPKSDVMLWIVPADFSGLWRVSLPGEPERELRLTQRFQMLSGTLGAQPLAEGRVSGSTLRLLPAGSAQIYTGTLDGDTISGEMSRAGAAPQLWRAQRVQRGRMDIDAGSELPFTSGSPTGESR
ncbi:MAG: class I SAM-dependent methyltransferase [Burkholderiales bacterium]|nr:class I SAM-dependent methyltransferase [Burkholderiales bacterium]